jgi:hypothetical protein
MLRCLFSVRVAVLAATVSLFASSLRPVAAQEPALEVFYRRLDPKEPFKYIWKGQAKNSNAGVFRWEVPESTFGTNGLDRNFTGYCAEVLVPITAEKTYRFRTNSLYDVANYGLKADDDKSALVAQRRARYIQELFGRYFRDPAAGGVGGDEAVAFQVALWEIIQETEPADGAAKFDLFGGDFRADYPRDEAPAFVRTAQTYLDSLTGNDALFYENPALRGRELVRLMGIPNAEGIKAQSQFALRYTGGGATGVAGGAVPFGGGGIGAIGGGVGGGPVGGVGGGFGGGGGGFTTGNGGGGSTVVPNGSSTTTTPTTVPIGGSSTFAPPTPSSSSVPVGGPDNTTPTNPVPAPPAVLLGLIAAGTLGSWRLGSRLLARK